MIKKILILALNTHTLHKYYYLYHHDHRRKNIYALRSGVVIKYYRRRVY
jgi:hypothetical protein